MPRRVSAKGAQDRSHDNGAAQIAALPEPLRHLVTADWLQGSPVSITRGRPVSRSVSVPFRTGGITVIGASRVEGHCHTARCAIENSGKQVESLQSEIVGRGAVSRTICC